MMKDSTLVMLLVGIFLFAFALGGVTIHFASEPAIVEVEKEVVVVTERIVEIEMECDACDECITTTTIEKIVERPCPECRCICKSMGAYEEDYFLQRATLGNSGRTRQH